MIIASSFFITHILLIKCKSLYTLNLANNKLEELPETIGNLHNLNAPDLSDNFLKELTESLYKSKSLQNLFLVESYS